VLGPIEVPSVQEVLESEHASDWLKRSVAELVELDPASARIEALWLYLIMKQREKAEI